MVRYSAFFVKAEVRMAKQDRQPGQAEFYAINGTESSHAHQLRPKHKTYLCGECGNTTHGRVLCDVIRQSDRADIQMCLCSCELAMPAIIVDKDGETLMQVPRAREFHSDDKWPPDLAKLYDEGARAYAIGAYTAQAWCAARS
jgi:hypothetical protein